jgi:hypothetical protein
MPGGQATNPVGRPRKELDFDTVEKLCSMQCTAVEIAGFFGVSVDTLDLRCKDWGYANFTDLFKECGADGKISLRRWQMKAAEKGNAALLIWLGKQYLNQKDLNESPEEERYDEPESLKE